MAVGSLARDIKTFACKYTGVSVNYKKTDVWFDGTAMNDTKADGTIYRKLGNEYFVDTDFLDGKDINPLRFGMKGGGVFDNSDVMDRILSLPMKSLKISFPAGQKFYFSRSWNIRKRVFINGNDGGKRPNDKSTILFAEGIDGVIFNRHNTNGKHEMVATLPNGTSPDDSVIENISIEQKNTKGSFSAYDINHSIGRAIGVSWHGLFNVGDTLKVIDAGVIDSTTGFPKVLGTATYNGVQKDLSQVIVIDADSSLFNVGDVVTWDGGNGTVSYLFEGEKIIAVNIVSGNLNAVNKITINGNEYTKFSTAERWMTVIMLGNISSGFPKNGVLLHETTAGHGIKMLARASVINCSLLNWGYNGIDILSTFNNANCFRIENTGIYRTRMNGLFVLGGDSNAGYITALDITHSGGCSIYDNSFLGNYYYGCHTSVFGLGAYKIIGFNNLSILSGCYTEGQPSAYPIYNSKCYAGPKVRVIGGDYGTKFSKDITDYSTGHINEGLINIKGEAQRIELKNEGEPRYAEGNVFSTSGHTFASSVTINREQNSNDYNPTIAFSKASSISVLKDDIRPVFIEGGVYQHNDNAGFMSFWMADKDFGTYLQINATAKDPSKAVYRTKIHPVVKNGNLVSIVVGIPGGNQGTIEIIGKGKYEGLVAKAQIVKGNCLSVDIIQPPTLNGSLTNTDPVRKYMLGTDVFYPNETKSISLGKLSNQWKETWTEKLFLNGTEIKKMTSQPNSTATDVSGLVSDFNSLIAKLKASGLME